MSQAQKVLMIIAGVVSIVWGVIFSFIVIPVFLVLVGFGSGEEAAYGWYFVIMYVATIANIFVSFMGKNSKSKGMLIANIVLGFLSGITLNAVGGILGLIDAANSKKSE